MTAALDLEHSRRILQEEVRLLEKALEAARAVERRVVGDNAGLAKENDELRVRLSGLDAALASERSAHADLRTEANHLRVDRDRLAKMVDAADRELSETRRQLEEARREREKTHEAIQAWNHCACDLCDDCLERFETAAPDAIAARAREAQGTEAAK